MEKLEYKKYVIAVLAVVLVSAIKLLVPGLGNEAPSLLYVFAIFLIANFQGFYPAVTATLLSVLALAFLFVQPQFRLTLDTATLTQCLTVLVEGLLLAWLLDKVKKMNYRLKKMNDTLVGYMEEILDKDIDSGHTRKQN